ncbi:hypothetical protein ACFO4E_07980 [Nocardiopsis mangrovi]|uniref:ATP-binding protein n=1 Tax=Nocardiopsis mangrovi TaxID=1179818 RepID=A0ABV9DW19_9ACTN
MFRRDEAIELLTTAMAPPGAGRQRGRSPFLVYEGMRGTGKTVLLRGVADELRGQIPSAYIDFDAVSGADIPLVLSLLSQGLYNTYPRYGRLRFPRLALGQHAITVNLDATGSAAAGPPAPAGAADAGSTVSTATVGPATLPDAERRHARMRASLRSLRGFDDLQGVLATAAAAVLGSLYPIPAEPTKTLSERAVKFATDPLFGSAHFLGRYLKWFADPKPAAGSPDPVHTLVELNAWANAAPADGRGTQHLIDDLMCAAFLADLVDFFPTGRAAATWAYDIVLLLDNAGTRLGRRFLDALDRAGAHAPETPLTVVAATRGDLLLGEPPEHIHEVRPSDPYAGPSEPIPAADHRPWRRYRLPDLYEDDVAGMIRAAGLAAHVDRRLFRAIHQFTGGHPGSTATIIGAVDRHRSSAGDLDLLLSTRPGVAPLAPTPPTLARRLRDDLIEPRIPPERIDELVTCAAARTQDDARQLVTDRTLVRHLHEQIEVLVALDLWNPDRGAGQVLLRRLLLRELAERGHNGGSAGGGGAKRTARSRPAPLPRWPDVVARLRKQSQSRGDSDAELYYALAEGDLRSVAEELTRRIDLDDPGTWLDLLLAVVTAPTRRTQSHESPTTRRDALVFKISQGQDPPPGTITGLIAGLWVASDPLCGLDRRYLYGRIAADLQRVAQDHMAFTPHRLYEETHRNSRLEELWA